MSFRFLFGALAVGAILAAPRSAAAAADCDTASFEAWLADFKTEAAAKGISQSAIASGLNGVTQDKSVLSRDHSQGVFNQSFEQFSGRMVPPRLTRGANMLKQYGSLLSRIEKDYGVPGEVLVAIWGLETDYGVNIGKFPTLRSLATLAYDCRRSGAVPGRIDGRVAHRRAPRRSRTIRNARRLGGRTRSDPVHAVVLDQIRRRFRRQRPPRPPAQRPRMCWLRRPIFSPAMAGNAARAGRPEAPISR